MRGGVHAIAFVFRAGLVLAGGPDLPVAEAVGKVEFKLAGIVVAAVVKILSGVATGQGIGEGIKNVAYGGLDRCPAFKQRLLKPRVQAPKGADLQRPVPDIPGGIVLSKIGRPSL